MKLDMKSEDKSDKQRLKDNKEFIPFEKDKIFKKELCNYGRMKNAEKYYVCNCSNDEFLMICENCYEECHKGEKKHEYIKMGDTPTFYDCHCGAKKHKVLEIEAKKEHEELQEDKCIFNSIKKFLGLECKFYKVDNYDTQVESIFCEQCTKFVYQLSSAPELTHEECKTAICQTERLNNICVLNISDFFKEIADNKENYPNLNLNIIAKIPFLKKLTIDYLSEELLEVKKHQNEELSESCFKFFNNYKTYSVLNGLNYIHNSFKNDNISLEIQNFFPEELHDIKPFLDILMSPVPQSKMKENSEFFLSSKILFSKFIYLFFFENFFKENNITNINPQNFINLNIYDRHIFYLDAKNFNLYSNKNNEKQEKIFGNIELYIKSFFEIMDRVAIYPEYFSTEFPILAPLAEVSLYLVKFNLLNEKTMNAFLNKLNEIVNTKVTNHSSVNGKFMYSLVKLVFYLLVLKNDKTTINYFKNPDDKEFFKTNHYTFTTNKENDLLSEILVKSLFTYDTRSIVYSYISTNQKKLIKYNYIFRKIFEILAGDNKVYEKNIINMKHTPSNQLIGLKENKDYTIKNPVTGTRIFEEIARVSDSLNKINSKFFKYEAKFEDYLTELNPILNEIKLFMNKEFECIPALDKKYLTITQGDLGNENNLKKIKNVQESVKYCNFFQALDGFLHIYAKEKKSIKNELQASKNVRSKFDKYAILSENMITLIYFLYLIIKDDCQNLLLLSSINSDDFITSFEDCDPYIYQFLEGISDFIFGQIHTTSKDTKVNIGNEEEVNRKESYLFDNYRFYEKLVRTLVNKISFDKVEEPVVVEEVHNEDVDLENKDHVDGEHVNEENKGHEDVENKDHEDVEDVEDKRHVDVENKEHKNADEEHVNNENREHENIDEEHVNEEKGLKNEEIPENQPNDNLNENNIEIVDTVLNNNEIIENKSVGENKTHIINPIDKEVNLLLNLKRLQYALKLCRKPVKFINWDESSLIDLNILINNKLKEFQQTVLVECLKTYLKFEHDQKMRLKNETILKLIKNYFMYLNEAITSDLYFYNIVNEENYLFTIEFLEDVIQKENEGKQKKLPILLKLNMIEFLNNNYFYIKIKVEKCPFSRLFKLNKYEYLDADNMTIPNLIGNINTQNENLDEEKIKYLDDLNIKSDKLIKQTLIRLEDIYNEADKIKPILRRRIALLSFFEKAVVRPTYNLVSMYLFYPHLISGKHAYKLYNVVVGYMKAVKFFYEQINITDIIKDYIEEIKELEKVKIFKLETFYIKSAVKVNKIAEDLINLENETKYYEVVKVVDIFKKYVSYILQDKKSYDPFGGLLMRELVLRTGILSPGTNPNNEMNDKIDTLLHKFNKIVEECTEKKRSFIKVLEDKQIEIDCVWLIIVVLLYDQIESDLTGFPDEPVIQTISGQNMFKFRIQSFYFYEMLNNLFTHCRKQFQEQILYKFWDSQSIFRDILLKFLYPSLINECKKLYELKRIENFPSISYILSNNIIKFFQNLCEGHNKSFQEKLFFDEVIENMTEVYDHNKEILHDLIGFNKVDVLLARQVEEHVYEDNNIPLVENEESNIRNNQKLLLDKYKDNVFFLKNNLDFDFTINNFSTSLDQLDKMMKRKYNIPNFLLTLMKLIAFHCDYSNKLDLGLTVKDFKCIKSMEDINMGINNLIIEIIQGNPIVPLFGQPLPSGIKYKSQKMEEEFFSFKSYLIEMRKLFLEQTEINLATLKIKHSMFKLINNISNQGSKKDIYFSHMILSVYTIEELTGLVVIYTKLLCQTYCLGKSVESDPNIINKEEFTKDLLNQMKDRYKKNKDMYDDDILKFISEIYLFIIKLSENGLPKAKELIELGKGDDEHLKNREQLKKGENGDSKLDSMNQIGNVMQFFNFIVKRCEFIILSDSNSASNDSVQVYDPLADAETNEKTDNSDDNKIVYYVIDPSCFLISENNIDNFFSEVDRTSKITKLKELINETYLFLVEVKYKSDIGKEKGNVKWMMEFDFKKVDIINFSISSFINLLILLLLIDGSFVTNWSYYFVLLIAFGQIIMNIYFLYVYFKAKYNYTALIERERLNLSNNKLSIKEFIQIYVLRSIFSDEVSLIYLNTLIPLICILFKPALILFPLQLFTVMKFVPTIKEIVMAFQVKYKQFLAMIGFLVILIFFYATIGFYFMQSEFVQQLDDGQSENLCASLLSCFITYFNLGARSGGGIGDVAGARSFKEGYLYWFRWVTDMIFYITVLLLIMNMLNGIIISTFSEIREENNNKSEDEENKCFICNRARGQFEKKKKSFDDHRTNEHNSRNYIYYFISILLLDATDLDADQSFIINCMKTNEISFFPAKATLFISDDKNADDEDDEGENENDDNDDDI